MDRALDVVALALERELRRVDSHDHEAVARVALVPRPQRRHGPQAVDAGVGPEVDEHYAAAQLAQRQGTVPARVQPGVVAGEVWCAAEHRQAALHAGLVKAGGPAQVREPPRDGVAALESAGRVREHGRQLVREHRLEAHVELGRHGDRGAEQQHAQRPLHRGPVPGAPDPLDDRTAAESDEQQDERRAGSVGERHHDKLSRGALGRRERDHRGEDRPGAGRVQEAERAADHHARPEAAATVARAEPLERRERPLHEQTEARPQERDPNSARTTTAACGRSRPPGRLRRSPTRGRRS